MSSHPNQEELLETWTETSAQMFESVVAANKVTLAAMGVDPPEENDEDELTLETVDPAEDRPEWETDGTAETAADLAVGDTFEFTKTIREEDVQGFAVASGDTNPLHLDEEYAEDTRFDGRIAHGTLVSGLISAALARMPGVVVYLSQDTEFHNPVRVGERLTARCEIVENLGQNQFRLTTQVVDGERKLIDGEAVVLIDEEPT